jgi:ABC-type antimicrobial peptide transport system permease subunit
MMSTIHRTLRRVCFMLMQFIGITLFSFGIAAHNKEAPLLRIGTLDVWLVLARYDYA